MKILFVGSYIPSFGISPILKRQGESLVKKGLDVEYYVIKGEGFLKYIKGIFEISRLLRNNDYDIIHGHYNYIGWLVSFNKKIPFVVSFMGSDLLKRKQLPGNVFNSLINRRIFNNAGWMICKTEELRNKIPNSNSVSIVPNGVNMNIFFPVEKKTAKEKLNLSVNKKYILFIGTKEKAVKNYPLAKEAVDGLNDNEIELINIFYVTQEKLNLYYNAVEALLLTSDFEGGVNVVKEAMACNCPVVSTYVGDVKLRLRNVTNSYICTNDANEITTKLKLLLANNSRTNGRDEIIKQKLTDEDIADQLIEIYNEVRVKKSTNLQANSIN